jgi:hypothetical protein
MSRAFSNAWVLLKQRGHAIMPNPEEEQYERDHMQSLIDRRVDNADDQSFTMDEYNQINSPLHRPQDVDTSLEELDYDHNDRRDLLLDMQDQNNIDSSLADDIHQAGRDMGPMADHERQSQANVREAEGMEMPMRPRGPPANIGQAGSTGAPPLTGNPFEAAMQTMNQRRKPAL